MADQEKREKVIDGLERCLKMTDLCLNNRDCPYNGCEDADRGDGCISIMMREALALLEMQVVHGEWKWSHGGQCSECGFHNSNFDYNYCPNCGAKMDGDANG